MAIKQKSGKLSLLRVHEKGTGYGPPRDLIDVEVVVKFKGSSRPAYGFQLRTGARLPAREGMLALLHDAFFNNLKVTIDYNERRGKNNHVLFRVWLAR
jgi:hypothetical protein